MAGWPRDERREGVKIMLQALAERRIGRRDQANAWIWRMAEYTREVHEEYAVQRWPETKRLLGLLVNSSGAAHARNARRLVHAARKEDRRLSAALLAAALAHTPEAEEALRGARTRMARKPAALARELLRNFPKGRRGKGRRRRKSAASGDAAGQVKERTAAKTTTEDTEGADTEAAPKEPEVNDDHSPATKDEPQAGDDGPLDPEPDKPRSVAPPGPSGLRRTTPIRATASPKKPRSRASRAQVNFARVEGDLAAVGRDEQPTL